MKLGQPSPYLWFLGLWIQSATNNYYSWGKKNHIHIEQVQILGLPKIRSVYYTPSIYILLDIVSNIEMVPTIREDVCRL